MRPILEFTYSAPKIGAGKHKNQLATNNNAVNWLRYYKTKIKNTFKDNLIEWSVPQVEHNYKSGTVEFQIYRPNKRRIDADAFGISSFKWTVDLLVQQGWFKDDDQVTFIFKPAIVETERIETDVKVRVLV